MARRRSKRHAKAHTKRTRKNPARKSHRKPRAVAVVVENPRPITMAKKRRKKHGSKSRRRRRHNPAPAAAPRRRRRRHSFKAHGRKRHHRRRNPGSPVADVLLAIGAGGVAAIAGKVLGNQATSLLPTGTPTQVVDGAKIALGVLAAIALAKKHPAVAAGVAVGLGAPAAVNLVQPLLPTSLQAIEIGDLLPGNRLLAPRVESMGAVEMQAIMQAASSY